MDDKTAELTSAIAFSIELSVIAHAQEFQLSLTRPAEQMAAAYFAMAADHREGLLLLVRAGAYSPAFALVRSIYEAHIRGAWALFCATDDECKVAFSKGVLPKFDTVVKRLDKIKASEGRFGQSRALAWDPFSDYAHGYMRQVRKWIGADAIRPSHTPDDVLDVLAIADCHYLQANIGMALLANQPSERLEAAQQEVLRRHRERKARTTTSL